MNYFDTCTDEKSYRERYIELCKQHHPDKGGDTRVMQDINAAYTRAKENGFTGRASQTSSGDYSYTSYSSGRKRHFSDDPDIDDFLNEMYGSGFFWRGRKESKFDRMVREAQEARTKAQREYQENLYREAREASIKEAKKRALEKYVQDEAVGYLHRVKGLKKSEVLEELGKVYRNFLRLKNKDRFK